jgi:hypothetical protein
MQHDVQVGNALAVFEWIKTRGGVAIWDSVNLSNPGASWMAPLKDDQGVVKGQPNWQASRTPSRVITDPAEIMVVVPREVKRFHVGIKRGDSMNFVLTDGASARVRRELNRAGEGAWYEFDRTVQDAIIYAVGERIPLLTYIGSLDTVQPVT